mgnify:CR=1 FL=1
MRAATPHGYGHGRADGSGTGLGGGDAYGVDQADGSGNGDVPAGTYESGGSEAQAGGSDAQAGEFAETFRSQEADDESQEPSGERHKTIDGSHKPSGEGHDEYETLADVRETLDGFPQPLRDRVEEAREEHRVPGVRGIIRDIRARRAFSATDLADVLDRDRSRLLRSYLKPMVEEGALELTHPENPRHPKQAYRTVDAQEDFDRPEDNLQ